MSVSSAPASPPVPTPAPAPRKSWRQRVVEPIRAQLVQGVTPDKIAATIAVGTTCSLFPFLGFTTLLNLGVGLWLRMNQPILQAVNYLLTPIHLVMIVAYVRVGEWIWRANDERFTVEEVLRVARDASLSEFLNRFGWAGIHAFTAWVISIPILLVCIYYPLRPVLRRAALIRFRVPPKP